MAENSSELNWYVATLRSGRSDDACKQLLANQYEYSYPMYIESGKFRPIIPGYILIKMPHHNVEFATVHSMSAIDKLLPKGSEPVPVPKKWIDEFHSRLHSGEYNVEAVELAPEPLPWFNKAEPLLVTSGPFTGHTGTFSHVRKGAVVVKLQFFGRDLELPLKGHQVQRRM